MKMRILCGTLALLLLVAPVGASLCGDCAIGRCPTADGSVASEAPGSSPAAAESMPCHSAMPEEEPPTEEDPSDCCPLTAAMAAASDAAKRSTEQKEPAPAPAGASMDCCSATSTPDSENPSGPAGSVVFDVALEASDGDELPAAVFGSSDRLRRVSPPLPPRPLYTLHAAFLI